MASNFVTIPDFLPFSINHSILVIDGNFTEIDGCALLCKTSPVDFDIYLYKTEEENTEWLLKVAKAADKVLVNLEPGSEIKDSIKESSKTLVIGEDVVSVVDYLMQKINDHAR